MSSRRVPSSCLPLAAGGRIMTSATCLLAVDMSRRVCKLFVDSYESTRQHSMRYVASLGVDHHRDHEESEETSIRCSSSSPQPPRTHGRRITTSVTSRSTEDVSNSVHNPSVGFYEPTQQGTTHCYDNALSSIACQRNEVDEDTSYRRVSSSYLPPPTSGCRTTTSTTAMLTTDTSKRAHYLPPRLHESTDQCLEVCPDGDHQEDTQDMSLRCVPSSSGYLCPPSYGRCITTVTE